MRSHDGVRWVEGKGGFFSQVEFGVDSGLSMLSIFFGYLFCRGGQGVKAKSTRWHLTFIPCDLANVVLLSPINQNRTFYFAESPKIHFGSELESAPPVMVCYGLLNIAAGPSNLSRFLLIFIYQLVLSTF